MQRIPLSQGQYAIVDDDLFAMLSEFKWSYRAERNGKQGYAVRHWKVDGKDRLCYLHRVILPPAPPGHEVIFLNHDRVDCRRENLKIVTKKEAKQHHRVRHDSQSGLKGVRYNHYPKTWTAFLYRDGHLVTIGTFDRRADAIEAYEKRLKMENAELHTAPAKVDRTAAALDVNPSSMPA